MPLSFMPPKGAISVEMMPSLMPTMPYSRASATRQMRPMPRLVARRLYITPVHLRPVDDLAPFSRASAICASTCSTVAGGTVPANNP